MSAPTKIWSSKFAFLCAMVGASIGLGNLWRFSYVAGENGGGAFIIVYLLIILLLCVPLVMAELAMGRRGGKSPVLTMVRLCQEGGHSRFWRSIGWLSIMAPVCGLCFYAVVAGWSLDYVFLALRGAFINITPAVAVAQFDDLLASPQRLILWYTLFLAATVGVIGRGVNRGIEAVTTFMLPALFVMIIALVVYGHLQGAPARAWQFMFNPDFSSLTWNSLLMALGQALFSITVGTGALLTYGAYLAKDIALPGPTWIIACSDTLAAVLCGLAVFTIVFASGLDPAGGPGLMFVTLPVALGSMPAGHFFGVVFFVLVFFAAFTSSLVMLEPFVSYLEDKGYKRLTMSMLSGAVIWLVGLSAVFSFNLIEEFKPLSFIPLYQDKNMFHVLEFTVSNVMLPLTALLIALFAGWVIPARALRNEMGLSNDTAFRLWRLLTRYIAPVAVGCVLVFGLF
ncbi:MAG: sodium-dependent transporter [Gammaproteobacteria bacterium]|nr:sodium-dependent transporter [Gammaproteobacteria bacterium]MCY4338074.1 sodium-dependent transporter [Gammaproteobacteria bacterium]